MRPALPQTYHQAYFRTKKGGLGIEQRNAMDEFLQVFDASRAELLQDLPCRFRVIVRFLVSEAEIARRAERLGYTSGIVRVSRHPVSGRANATRRRGRWPVGWLREGDAELLFEEIFAADEEERLAASPHALAFPQVGTNGRPTQLTLGRRINRRLSPLDARFLANISGLPDGARVLDPFAGICVLVDALRRRDLVTAGGDIDTRLRVGLDRHTQGFAAIVDARHLPFTDGAFDGVITEPPYHERDRAAVIEAIPELARVTKPAGRVVLLLADFMVAELEIAWRNTGLSEIARYPIRRHGLRSECIILQVHGNGRLPASGLPGRT